MHAPAAAPRLPDVAMMSRRLSRRAVLGAGLASWLTAALPGQDDAMASGASGLAEMIRHPLLAQSLYRLPVSRQYAPDGAAGTNQAGYRWIEEQRQGAEWIVRGLAQGNAEWIALGWRELDWGLGRQQADGGFASADPFHSTSFFVEALARGCLLDRTGATAARLGGLARAAAWLMRPDAETKGTKGNLPFTHRRYILAAALGETAEVTTEPTFARRAEAWAMDGLALQGADGVNPERGGFDAGYQMVGVLMALRYLPVCQNAALVRALKAMIGRAVRRELARLKPDGSIDPEGSTRIRIEKSRGGELKDVPYGEVMQALVYGAQAMPGPAWLEPARRIALFRRWMKA